MEKNETMPKKARKTVAVKGIIISLFEIGRACRYFFMFHCLHDFWFTKIFFSYHDERLKVLSVFFDSKPLGQGAHLNDYFDITYGNARSVP